MFDDLVKDKKTKRYIELTRCPFCKSVDTKKLELMFDHDKEQWLYKIECNRCKGIWYITHPDGMPDASELLVANADEWGLGIEIEKEHDLCSAITISTSITGDVNKYEHSIDIPIFHSLDIKIK